MRTHKHTFAYRLHAHVFAWATKEQMCDITHTHTHTHTQTQHTLLDGPHSRISYTYVQRVRRVKMCLAGSLHQWSVRSLPLPHAVAAAHIHHDLNLPGKLCVYPPLASPQKYQYVYPRGGRKTLVYGLNNLMNICNICSLQLNWNPKQAFS